VIAVTNGQRQASNDWHSDAFVLHVGTANEFLVKELFEGGLGVRGHGRKLPASLVCTVLWVDLSNVEFERSLTAHGNCEAYSKTPAEESGIISTLVRSLAMRLAGDRPLLTVVRRRDHFDHPGDSATDSGYCNMRPLRTGLLKAARSVVLGGPQEGRTTLLLTGNPPGDIPAYQTRAVASIRPIPGEEDRLHRNLREKGIRGLCRDRFKGCDLLVAPSLGDICGSGHAYVAIVHQSEARDFVVNTIDCVRKELRFRMHSEWRPEDFSIMKSLGDRIVYFRPDSALNHLPALRNRRKELLEPFTSSGLCRIEETGTGLVTFLGKCTIMDDLVSTLAYELSRGRELLTIVGGNKDRFEDESHFPGDFEHRLMPSIEASRLRKLYAFLFEGRRLKTEDLWVTREGPLDIPGYHLRTVVSLCPQEGQRDRLYRKLLHEGFHAFDEDDLRACRMFYVPSFYDENSLEEPYVGIIHLPEETEFVSKTIDGVTARLGFTLD